VAASLPFAFAGSGWPLLLSPATASAAETDNSNSISKEIEKSVTELGYPQQVAEGLVRLVQGWKCDVWQQTLGQARQKYEQHRISPAEVARVEQEVVQELSQTIGREIAKCGDEEEAATYFYLPKVIEDKKAAYLGYSQLVFILGQSLGLRVTPNHVRESVSGPPAAETLHVVCCVELRDGKMTMVDLTRGLVSKPFTFFATYRAIGNYWELRKQTNPLEIPRQIQIWNANGLQGAVCFDRGSAYARSGRLEKAVADFTEAIRLSPKFAEAYSRRAAAYESLGQMEKALADCNQAVKLDPKYTDTYANRGKAYARLGQLADALSDFGKAIELNPKIAAAYSNRGTAYARLGQLANAIADYTKAIELNPKYAEAYFNRGTAELNLGQLSGALADFSKAIELNPKYALAYSNRGNAYGRLGQLANACSDYTKAIELNPKYADAYSNRGIVNAAMGKMTEAKADLQKAVELNPALRERVKKIAASFKLEL
jgi:tetratricopeptide (TPR) repeat protein